MTRSEVRERIVLSTIADSYSRGLIAEQIAGRTKMRRWRVAIIVARLARRDLIRSRTEPTGLVVWTVTAEGRRTVSTQWIPLT